MLISVAEIWDRLWWSMMISILIGLGWLKFLDPLLPPAYIYLGMGLALAAGVTYFISGIRKMLAEKRSVRDMERTAYEEMMRDLGMEVRHD